MKKIISIFSTITLLISFVFSFSTTAFAASAENIYLGNKLQYTYDWDKDDFEHYYKFVPDNTGYYTITVSSNENLIDYGLISISILDGNKNEIAWGDWSDSAHNISATTELRANKAYYFYIECWQKSEITLTAAVTKHTHNLNKEIYKAEIDGSDYYSGDYWYECKTCDYYTYGNINAVKSIKLSATSYTYNGKVRKPTVTVKDTAGKTISSSNYTVTYAKGRKNVGKYKVTVKFKGSNYTGSKNLYFTIKPKATTLSGVTAKSKGFTVKWKKLTTQTTGYQIQYSTDKNFKKNNKTVTISKNSTTSKTISKLSAKKKYFIRIRTYKTVSGKKYYSAWSKSKSVTTKGTGGSSKSKSNSASKKGSTVYITPTGKKYHYSKACAGKNAIKTTLSKAKKSYGPCKKCAQ